SFCDMIALLNYLNAPHTTTVRRPCQARYPRDLPPHESAQALASMFPAPLAQAVAPRSILPDPACPRAAEYRKSPRADHLASKPVAHAHQAAPPYEHIVHSPRLAHSSRLHD